MFVIEKKKEWKLKWSYVTTGLVREYIAKGKPLFQLKLKFFYSPEIEVSVRKQ